MYQPAILVMQGGRLVGQFSTDEVEEEVRRLSHMAPSLLQGVWTSCRAAPCQGMGGRKEDREGQEHRQVSARWSVVVPEEEAWMTQATSLCNQKGRERQRHREKKEGEADMQATEESGNTPTFVT